MTPFVVLSVVAGVLWLVHAGLGAAGHRAYRFTRWVLFGGLLVTAGLFLLRGVQASRSVPPEWKNDSLDGVFEGVLALETLLVLLAIALLEVIHVAVAQTVVDARAKSAAQVPDPANSP